MSFYSLSSVVDRSSATSYIDDLFATYPGVMSVPQVAEVLGRPTPTVASGRNRIGENVAE